MNAREDKVYLEDISGSIEIIFQHIKDMTEFEFSNNVLVQDAVIRRFEIIGEAVSKISADFKSAHPQIEWQLMKDMRNKLSHEYFGVSMNTIYSTIKQDLPFLLEQIKKLI
jgi:uncharacterized protein with HEPN domain